MPAKRTFFNLVLLLVVIAASYGVGDSQPVRTPVSFDHLTVEDGLSHNTVYALLQDQSGLIWIGTRYGLNRFDGYECKVFLPDEKPGRSLWAPTVQTLTEDRSGKIWIGHREGGISIFDPQTGQFERFFSDETTGVDWNKTSIRRIYEDRKGYVWIGTINHGVFVFNEKRRLVEHLCNACQPAGKSLTSDFVFDFLEDNRGTVWIATDGHGLNGYDLASKRTFSFNAPDSLNMQSFEKSLCLDRQGNLWIGTTGSGLYKYDFSNRQFTHFYHQKNKPDGLSHNRVTDLSLDSAGNLWVATDGGGLNIFDPATGHFQHITSTAGYPQALNTDAVYKLMSDRMGNLWVGTFNGGVNIRKAFPPPFFIHENQNEYHRMGLRSVLALKKGFRGKIWLGTDGGGLFAAETHGKSFDLKPVEKVAIKAVTCLAAAGEDSLWVGSFAEGLACLDIRTGQVRYFLHRPGDPASLSHNNVWDLEVDSAGGLWIGTLGGGLNYLAPGTSVFRRWQPEPSNPNSIASVQVVDVLTDRNKRFLWVATEDKGLDRLDLQTGEFLHFSKESTDPARHLSGNNLQCLFQDRQGRIWAGTEFNGLNCILPDHKKILHFDTEDGLPSNMINSIVGDDGGFLWIGTQKGIIRWDPERHVSLSFGTDDNLRNNQYNPRAALFLPDGRLLFGGSNGFSMLESNSIQPNLNVPEVVFTGMRLAGQPVPVGPWNGRTILNGNLNAAGARVHLTYADRGLIIEFTSTDYTDPAKNRFACRLEGFEKHWNFLDAGQRRATYSSLKGGKYILKVKASNNDHDWSEERSLSIEVEPPFWQKWWFIILATALLAGLGYLVVTYMLEHEKAVYQEKSFLAEQEIMRLKNENLEKEIEAKQSRLSASMLQSAHKNQFLADLKSDIQKLERHDPELRKVVRAIDNELNQEDYWEQFQLTFNQTHQEFVQQLEQRHPDISNTDVRLCCFIRMGMSNAEIASVLNITVNGVEQGKYRLKKKLNLEKEASVNDYIRGL